tara:strand:- start:19 stop:324 length:306 start_codon:yes stop_codon:yes gene_type:complete
MIIFVDIDDTICYYEKKYADNLNYSTALPYKDRIEKINRLYDNGDIIVYWTARGTLTQKMWFDTTYKQLTQWGCKFHELRMGKPVYDLFIDDKNISSDNYF